MHSSMILATSGGHWDGTLGAMILPLCGSSPVTISQITTPRLHTATGTESLSQGCWQRACSGVQNDRLEQETDWANQQTCKPWRPVCAQISSVCQCSPLREAAGRGFSV